MSADPTTATASPAPARPATSPAADRPEPLVAVENLTKHFPIRHGVFRRQVGSVRAVDGLDFEIGERETLGLVGESGCGKSTAGRVILRLHDATNGRIAFRGQDIGGIRGDRCACCGAGCRWCSRIPRTASTRA